MKLTLDVHEIALIAVLVIVVLLILRALEKRSQDRHNPFDLNDLLMGEDGKASPSRLVMFGSFVLTSWVIIFQTLNKSLSDATFGVYVAAWVVPAVARIIKPAQSTDSTEGKSK